jgi:phosphate-selective porin OprO and OprP
VTHPLVLRTHVTSAIQSSISLLLSMVVACTLTDFARAQQLLTEDDAAAIYERLNQQEAEIERLRLELAQHSTTGELLPPDDGDPAPLPPPADDDQLADMLERLETLEAANKKPDKAEEKKEEKKEPEWVDMSADKWTVKLGGHVQGDQVFWANKDPAITSPLARDYFEFRRLRLMADGVGYGVYDFRIQMDIEPESGDGVATPVVDIKDAYLTINEVAFFNRVRFGNFFVPFSLEQVTNDTNNIFMERSIPTQGIFAADREVGTAFYGVNDSMDVTWTGGVFYDSISESLKERIDSNQGVRASGRLTYLPYYDEPSNGRYMLHTGCGVLYTQDQNDLIRFRARPQIHEGPFLIDSGDRTGNSYTTANVELATVLGSFSAQSELFVSSVDLDAADPATLYGSYVYMSYFLTGENRIYERFGQHGAQFGRNVPFSNFFLIPGGIGPGGWEVKGRWSYLDLGELDSGVYNDMTLGFNWYWSDRMRVMLDWIRPITSANTEFGSTESDIIATRLDFNF